MIVKIDCHHIYLAPLTTKSEVLELAAPPSEGSVDSVPAEFAMVLVT